MSFRLSLAQLDEFSELVSASMWISTAYPAEFTDMKTPWCESVLNAAVYNGGQFEGLHKRTLTS